MRRFFCLLPSPISHSHGKQWSLSLNILSSLLHPLCIAKHLEIHGHFNLSKICEGDVFVLIPCKGNGLGQGGTVARTTRLVATSASAQAQLSAGQSGFVTSGDWEQQGSALRSPLTVEQFTPHRSRASSVAGSLRLQRGSCSSAWKVRTPKHPTRSRSHWSELVTAARNSDN